jgi:hypothetical protein
MSGPKERLASAISAGQSTATVFAGDLADVGGPKLKYNQSPGELVEVKADDITKLLDGKPAPTKTTTPKGDKKENA